jgi:hypothetical protein
MLFLMGLCKLDINLAEAAFCAGLSGINWHLEQCFCKLPHAKPLKTDYPVWSDLFD